MTHAIAAPQDPSTDPRIDPQVRAFLTELNKDSSPFWELAQPQPQDILTALQDKTPVDMSGVTTVEKTITQDGKSVKIYIMTPERTTDKPGVLFFIHGGVWIVGNFQNHRRLLRDLVVGSGQIGVFVEYTSLRPPNTQPSWTNAMPPSNGWRRMPASSAQTAAASRWPATPWAETCLRH